MNDTYKGKKILILGAISSLIPLVEAAKRMGAYVCVADYNRDAPAKRIADEAVLIDALDVDALVQYCIDNDIDAVTTGYLDILLTSCYEVCKRLDLPCYMTPKMISLSTDKIDFKETCMEYGLKVPVTYVKGNNISGDTLASISYPVFVKPLDSSGSKGAAICRNKNELMQNFEAARKFSKQDVVIVEDYLEGVEFLLNYVAVGGEYRMISFFDRYKSQDRGGAMNFSNIALAPSKEIDYYYQEINPKVEKMFKSLGFTDGLFFMQGFTNGKSVAFYEMGCRLGGAYPVVEEAVLGCNAFDMIVRYAFTGKMLPDISVLNVQSAKYPKIAVDYNYLMNRDKVKVEAIRGIEEVKQLSNLIGIEQFIKAGDYVGANRAVDIPVMSIYTLEESMDKVKDTLSYFNDVIQVTDEKGASLLTMKYDPELL